jgi:hypothetical protein
MAGRMLVVWFAMLVVASINGGIREAVLIPRLGEVAGRAVSSVTLSLLILLLTYQTVEWLHPPSARGAWTIGLIWVSLTLAFEFLAGHFLFGTPWKQLTEDYHVLRGRIWVLVLVTTATAPRLCAAARGLFAAAGSP